MEKITFRFAERKDVPLIMEFIRALAAYEKAAELVEATEQSIKEWLFEKERAEVLFELVDGKEIGFALFFESFATYPGKGGIYLDDLYIKPEYRGKAFFKKLAKLTLERGGIRMEWLCLDWNPSYEFYKKAGGTPLTTCTTFRIQGADLEQLSE